MIKATCTIDVPLNTTITADMEIVGAKAYTITVFQNSCTKIQNIKHRGFGLCLRCQT